MTNHGRCRIFYSCSEQQDENSHWQLVLKRYNETEFLLAASLYITWVIVRATQQKHVLAEHFVQLNRNETSQEYERGFWKCTNARGLGWYFAIVINAEEVPNYLWNFKSLDLDGWSCKIHVQIFDGSLYYNVAVADCALRSDPPLSLSHFYVIAASWKSVEYTCHECEHANAIEPVELLWKCIAETLNIKVRFIAVEHVWMAAQRKAQHKFRHKPCEIM